MEKNIVVGITGSIAAYKAPGIVRKLRSCGWDVRVVMTINATEFITPLTMEVVSANPVYVDMFERETEKMQHIALSEFASLILVAPATANVLGKIASGICDDLLTAAILAFSGKVIFAPAMNENMWMNSIVAQNVEKLKTNGYVFVEPEKGQLASGKEGIGRLASIERIIDCVEREAKSG